MGQDEHAQKLLWQYIYPRQVPQWHFPMLHDTVRHNAYAAALSRAISFARQQGHGSSQEHGGVSVIDIGTGSGLLAMMAARAGADRVVGLEMVAAMAAAAREIVAANRWQWKSTGHVNDTHTGGGAEARDAQTGRGGPVVSIVQAKSTSLVKADVPALLHGAAFIKSSTGSQSGGKSRHHGQGVGFNVLVSETLDNGLIGPTNWLQILAHAQRHLLAQNALVIPAGAKMWALPVESIQLRRYLSPPMTAHGFDLSVLQRLQPHDTQRNVGKHGDIANADGKRHSTAGISTAYEPVRLDGVKYTSLGQAVNFWNFDFTNPTKGTCNGNGSCGSHGNGAVWAQRRRAGGHFDRGGVLDAFVVFWDLDMLGDQVQTDDEGKETDTILLSNAPSGYGSHASNSGNEMRNDNNDTNTGFQHWDQVMFAFRGGVQVAPGPFSMYISHNTKQWSFHVEFEGKHEEV